MNTKCTKCGLVNWAGAVECDRCGSVLGVKAARDGVNPFENGNAKSSGGVKAVVGLVVLVVAALVVYQFVKSDPTAASKAQANSNANVDVNATLKAMSEQATKSLSNDFKAPTPFPTMPKMSDPEMKKLFQKSAEEQFKNRCNGPGAKPPGC